MNQISKCSVWVLALFLCAVPEVDAKTTLKVATLAPPGSSWMKIFDGMNRELKERTNGEVRFKFYPGGAMGDEKDVVRKMAIGQIHGGALTSVGLGEINSHVLVLQLPLLFKGYKELDYVREKMAPRFEEIFAKKGYVILGWGDVGYTYIMANAPVTSKASLANTKMWVWVDDPISKKVFAIAGIQPVPLSVPDVLPSLQTGLIDAVYSSPLASIALQWNTKVKYIATMPLAIGVGATLVSKKQFDKINPEHQKVLLEVSSKWHKKLVSQIRKDNKTSVKALKKQGIVPVKIGKAEKGEWARLSKKVQAGLAGSLYPKALLSEVRGHIKDSRAGKK